MKAFLVLLVPLALSACSLNKQFVLAMDKNVPAALDQRDKLVGDVAKAKDVLVAEVGQDKADQLWGANELPPYQASDVAAFKFQSDTVKNIIAEAKKKVEEE